MGDGCNMEGVTNEAASLAGHLGLGKLIVFYDANKISIDGHTDLAFTERVWERYEALDWHVQKIEDGNHDVDGIRSAIENAKKVTDKPSFIQVCGAEIVVRVGLASGCGESGGWHMVSKQSGQCFSVHDHKHKRFIGPWVCGAPSILANESAIIVCSCAHSPCVCQLMVLLCHSSAKQCALGAVLLEAVLSCQLLAVHAKVHSKVRCCKVFVAILEGRTTW